MKIITDDGNEHDIAFDKIDADLKKTDVVVVYVRGADTRTAVDISQGLKKMFPNNQVVVTDWDSKLKIAKHEIDYRDLFKRSLRILDDKYGIDFVTPIENSQEVTDTEANEIRRMCDEIVEEDEAD